MELKLIDRSTIERALGIIEGVACGVPESAADRLYTAVEMIDAVLSECVEPQPPEPRQTFPEVITVPCLIEEG